MKASIALSQARVKALSVLGGQADLRGECVNRVDRNEKVEPLDRLVTLEGGGDEGGQRHDLAINVEGGAPTVPPGDGGIGLEDPALVYIQPKGGHSAEGSVASARDFLLRKSCQTTTPGYPTMTIC